MVGLHQGVILRAVLSALIRVIIPVRDGPRKEATLSVADSEDHAKAFQAHAAGSVVAAAVVE